MELNRFSADGHGIAEVVADGVVIWNAQDALDLIAEAGAQGAYAVILHEQHLTPAFFNVKTRLAGDILQKHANYGTKVAIVGELEKCQSKSLRAFIVESNRGDLVFFRSRSSGGGRPVGALKDPRTAEPPFAGRLPRKCGSRMGIS